MQNSRPVSFALIGCGLVGQRRAAALPSGMLRYVNDLDRSRAEQTAMLHPGSTVADESETVFEDKGVTALIVSTINSSLAPITLAAVEGRKDVLVEKPAAFGVRELEAIETAALSSNFPEAISPGHWSCTSSSLTSTNPACHGPELSRGKRPFES